MQLPLPVRQYPVGVRLARRRSIIARETEATMKRSDASRSLHGRIAITVPDSICAPPFVDQSSAALQSNIPLELEVLMAPSAPSIRQLIKQHLPPLSDRACRSLR